LGASHAIALTSATSSGGKTARATRPRFVLEPLEPLLAEASSPVPDAIGRHIYSSSDVAIGVPTGRQQHELGAHHDPVGQRQTRRPPLQLGTHSGLELDTCCHSSHAITFVNPPAVPSTRQNLRRAALRQHVK